jgi:hypothetical protein
MKPRRRVEDHTGHTAQRPGAHVQAGCTECPTVWQRRSHWLYGLFGSMLLLSSCQPTINPHPLQGTAVGYRFDDPPAALTPFSGVQWKAILLAGDHSIGAFDRAIEALARLFQQHHIEVVQRFSSERSKVSDDARLATVAELRHAIPEFQVKPGEGCIVYATSHGTMDGLKLTQDRPSGNRLNPRTLKSIVHAACGDAPTVMVLSGCYTGIYLRDETIGPHIILMTASAANRQSFGCRAGATYTYYDDCFLREFPQALTWQELYRAVSHCVDVAERPLHVPPSEPQAFFGRLMKDLPIPRP